ncbi:MAG: hypothetical protein IE909_12155 [Campylobacterales bacterium]|nr:hypothetical protein [Campylobacterales bacterium]
MKKQIVAKTYTPIYDKMEDRIRLSINYQQINDRIDLMITRSFMLDFISAMEDFIEKFYLNDLTQVQEIFDEFQKESQTKNNQNHVLSKTRQDDLKLLQSLEDLLVKVDFKYDKKTQKTTIVFTTKQGYTVVSTLDGMMLKNIFQVLKKSIPKIKWGISLLF